MAFKDSYGPNVIVSLLSDKNELMRIIAEKNNYIKTLEEKLLVYEGGNCHGGSI